MSWFKVDDGFANSKPVLRIPRRYRAQAVGLWTLAGTWSAKEETDGFVPEYVLEELCGTPAIAQQLVKCGLWEDVNGSSGERDGNVNDSYCDPDVAGWQFRNWAKYQPTKSELEEKREKERIRKAEYRMSQRDTNGTGKGQTQGHQRESDTPDPTRPDPTLTTEPNGSVGPRKRGTRLTDDFTPTSEMIQWAKENTPHVDGRVATQKFINYWTSKTGKDATKLDWVKTWKNWMLTENSRAPQQRTKPTVSDKMRNTLALDLDTPPQQPNLRMISNDR